MEEFDKPLDKKDVQIKLNFKKNTGNAVQTNIFETTAKRLQSTDNEKDDLKESESKIVSNVEKLKSVEMSQVKIPNDIYQIPPWAITCTQDYFLEEIKNGCIIKKHNLNNVNMFVIGRHNENISYRMLHPSISRYHLVFQYCSGINTRNRQGWYIRDLSSNNGTILNKKKLEPNVYYPYSIGSVVKLGFSMRIFVLQGNIQQEDDEIEEDLPMQTDPEPKIDVFNQSEKLSLDPAKMKKVLRVFFDQEGVELKLETQQLENGSYQCQLELPIFDNAEETSTLIEIEHEKSKAEAIKKCIDVAYHHLAENGYLKRKTFKRIIRESVDDLYEDEEDSFYDRSGDLEKKIEKRSALYLNKVTKLKYNDVVSDITKISNELSKIMSSLEKVDKKENASTQLDDLDAYMDSLNKGLILNKSEILNLKSKRKKLTKQLQELRKMELLLKPRNLPIIECQQFKHYFDWEKISNNIFVMYKVIKGDKLESLFSNIEICMRLFLSMMVANCKNERTFSKLKIIKDELRNCLAQPRLNAFSLISIENNIYNDISFDNIISDFSQKKVRKQHL
ncbi:hypothetical protein A3Q56_06919 [Intoshia linei]|uniref:FHA domain-containing protein n=1 Tax=Intoshia linei TaxID=1819745 RepID=A0A177AVZ8_9BILA|nr:hypothetical protein A3Q56_06919 [Intoshia linei]